MRIVVAIGGNALLRRGQPADHAVQQANVRTAVRSLAGLARNHQLVIVHGNGPQVGMLALESAADPRLDRPYPLDVLVAETQGMIGYWLTSALRAAVPAREVVTVLTQTVVERGDPAFAHPTKFIGPGYDRGQASRLARERRWAFRPDGERWRRVVPSPNPTAIIEIDIVRRLLDDGTIVIAGGGGGIPVVREPTGNAVHGIEAVVDKDLVAALLATELAADALLILTDVDAVYRGFGTPEAAPITHATADELTALGLPDGSMLPKVQACQRFLRQGGRIAAIGALDHAAAILTGRSGTQIISAFRRSSG